MVAKVTALFTAPAAGVPMIEHQKVQIVASGIKGDRYAEGRGIYQLKNMLKVRHVTLIAEEAMEEANRALKELGVEFEKRDMRRNIFTRGIDLNALVGGYAAINRSVVIEGVELADPCLRPPALLNCSARIARAFRDAFANRGGLRARVLVLGEACVGHAIEPIDEEALLDFASTGHVTHRG